MYGVVRRSELSSYSGMIMGGSLGTAAPDLFSYGRPGAGSIVGKQPQETPHMAQLTLAAVLQHLRTDCAARELEPLPDGGLLERFLTARDEAAFAALVYRHGPMVLGVCRR